MPWRYCEASFGTKLFTRKPNSFWSLTLTTTMVHDYMPQLKHGASTACRDGFAMLGMNFWIRLHKHFCVIIVFYHNLWLLLAYLLYQTMHSCLCSPSGTSARPPTCNFSPFKLPTQTITSKDMMRTNSILLGVIMYIAQKGRIFIGMK